LPLARGRSSREYPVLVRPFFRGIGIPFQVGQLAKFGNIAGINSIQSDIMSGN
jgi:hypothetical protein